MKRFLQTLAVSLFALPLLAAAPITFAQPGGGSGDGIDLGEVGGAAGLNDANLATVIGRLISIMLGLLGIIFLVLILYAGFLWMTAAGNDKNVEKAKSILTSSVIGLILILAAYAIANFVVDGVVGSLTS